MKKTILKCFHRNLNHDYTTKTKNNIKTENGTPKIKKKKMIDKIGKKCKINLH